MILNLDLRTPCQKVSNCYFLNISPHFSHKYFLLCKIVKIIRKRETFDSIQFTGFSVKKGQAFCQQLIFFCVYLELKSLWPRTFNYSKEIISGLNCIFFLSNFDNQLWLSVKVITFLANLEFLTFIKFLALPYLIERFPIYQ